MHERPSRDMRKINHTTKMSERMHEKQSNFILNAKNALNEASLLTTVVNFAEENKYIIFNHQNSEKYFSYMFTNNFKKHLLFVTYDLYFCL